MDTITCNDQVFGVMKYKHRWEKKGIINIFGKEYEVTVVAKAYSQKPITEEQRISYKKYSDNQLNLISNVERMIFDYVNRNMDYIANEWVGARTIISTTDLKKCVSPKTILFKQDGTTVLLFDCTWDIEHGLGVMVFPNMQIGSQDLFL